MYMSTKVAAKYLGLSPETLDSWRWRRVGPPYFRVMHPGGKKPMVFYTQEQLDDWVSHSSLDYYNGDGGELVS